MKNTLHFSYKVILFSQKMFFMYVYTAYLLISVNIIYYIFKKSVSLHLY